MVESPYLQGDIGGGDMSRTMSKCIFDTTKKFYNEQRSIFSLIG